MVENAVNDPLELRQSFAAKAVRLNRLVVQRFRGSDPSSPSLDGQHGHLLRTIEINYRYTHDWNGVLEAVYAGHDYMLRRGFWRQWVGALELAVDVARQLGDDARLADMQYRLGIVLHRQTVMDGADYHLRQAAELYEALGNGRSAARAWSQLGELHVRMSQFDTADHYLQRALEAQLKSDDRAGLAITYTALGNLAWWLGDFAAATKWSDAALALPELAEDSSAYITIYVRLGNIATVWGNTEEGIANYEKALAFAKRSNDAHARLLVEVNLGIQYALYGDLKRAEELLRQASDRAMRSGSLWVAATAQVNLAEVYSEMGQTQDAVATNQRGVAALRKLGEAFSLCASLVNLSGYLRDLGQLDTAEAALNEALGIAQESSNNRIHVLLRREQGELAMARRQWAVAEELLQETERIGKSIDDPVEHFKTSLALAQLFLLCEEWDAFATNLAKADALAGAMGHALSRAKVSQLAGDGALAHGDLTTALQAYGSLYELLQSLNDSQNLLAQKLTGEVMQVLAPYAEQPAVRDLLDTLADC